MMRVSGICAGLPFKAQVESTNPLINGNWAYLQDPSAQGKAENGEKKESHWFRNTILTLIVLGLAAWGFAKGANTETVKNLMSKEGGTLKEKALKFVGKIGGYVNQGWDKVKGIFAKKAS